LKVNILPFQWNGKQYMYLRNQGGPSSIAYFEEKL
jgi:hypothetical protein